MQPNLWGGIIPVLQKDYYMGLRLNSAQVKCVILKFKVLWKKGGGGVKSPIKVTCIILKKMNLQLTDV